MRNLLPLAVAVFLMGNSLAGVHPADVPLGKVPAPQPPFVARAPAQSSWLIVITPNKRELSGPHAKPVAKVLKAQLWTKSGAALQCANEWSDGTRTEDTIIGSTKYAQSPDGRGVHQLNPRLDPRYHDFSAGDFEMLDWITPKNYVGAYDHAGERCYLFRTKGVSPGATAATPGQHDQSLAEVNAPASPTSAYISIRTGLPVLIENAQNQYRFHFGLPGELKMP